jgi:hypothetical protein
VDKSRRGDSTTEVGDSSAFCTKGKTFSLAVFLAEERAPIATSSDEHEDLHTSNEKCNISL